MLLSPLRRRQRTAARVALYASLLLTGGVAVSTLPLVDNLATPSQPEWSLHDYSREPEVVELQELVRIDTTTSTGREIDAARYLAAKLGELGLEPVVEPLLESQANLWAIVEGERPEAIVLHSHLDTDDVPDPDAWHHPPWSATIEGPWIYGRGSFDMKSVTVAQLEAVRAVQERVRRTGEKPPRSLVFLATGSEETGSELGARWIVEQHPDLVRRFWALLTEGGVNEAVGDGRVKYWGIAHAQKHFVRLAACSASRGQLEQLRRALLEHEIHRRVLTPEARVFFEAYSPTRNDPLLRQVTSSPEGAVRSAWAFRYLPPYLRALYRNEVHPLGVVADAGGAGFRLPIVLHLVPGEDVERAREELLPPWLVHGVRIVEQEPIVEATTRGSPHDHEAFRRVAAVVRARYEGAAVGPYFLPFYDNDARYFRAAGIPSYGFSPFLATSTDSFTVGGLNERITVQAFLDGVALYREAVFSLVGWAPEPDKK
jgi:acetylornithine deacetylase/succinyl-diaminopimelate desuccinylase-like protein